MNAVNLATPSALTSSLSPLRVQTSSASMTEAARTDASRSTTPSATTPDSTPLTLSTTSAPVVYARPQLPRITTWERASEDSLSRQIEKNEQAGSSLGQRWKGLGGALLSQFARTGEAYSQTLAHNIDSNRALDGQLQSLREGAAEVTLELKTRAGQSVQLRLTSRSGGGADAVQGLQVDIRSAGPLGVMERQALGRLAEGLDKAIAGLTQQGGPELDLEGLMAFDRQQFSSLNVSFKAPTGEGKLRSFSLQLGQGDNRLALQTDRGEVNVRLDNASVLSSGTPAQREAALARQLRQVDAAAARGMADDSVVSLFKTALTQMHGAAPSQEQAQVQAKPLQLLPALAGQIQEKVSGLADFEASFSSDSERYNGDGVVTAKSKTEYTLSQRTEMTQQRQGDIRVEQVVNAQLKASIMQARNGGMLMPHEGNYDVIEINDLETQRTLLEAVDGELLNATRTTEIQQRTHWKMLEQHRAVDQRSTPQEERFVESLLR